MSTVLTRIKTGYTNGGRGLGMALMGRFRSLPFTPNQITVAGLSLNAVAGVLIYEQRLRVGDGRVRRRQHPGHPGRGARPVARQADPVRQLPRLDDRPHLRRARAGRDRARALASRGTWSALASVFVALVGSFLVSYTRAKAEALGLSGTVGLMGRAERIVLVAVALPFAGRGSLPYAMYLLAALTAFTVFQRVNHVRKQLDGGD